MKRALVALFLLLVAGPAFAQTAVGPVTQSQLTAASITRAFGIAAVSPASQTTATALAAVTNHVSTGTPGAVLLSGTIKQQQVFNDTAATLSVFPPSGGTIAGFTLNAAVTIVAGGSATFLNTGTNTWSAF